MAVDAAVPDMGGDLGAVDADTPDEAGADMGEPDAVVRGCEFPATALPEAPELVALAEAPEACGQPPFTWLDVPELGDVVELDETFVLNANLLNGVARAAGLMTHRPFEYDVELKRISYLTQDRGELIEATTVVASPIMEDPGTLPIVLMLHGTSGFNDSCAPSRDQAWRALSAIFASWGYVTVAPDFIGLKGFGAESEFLHPYLVGQATALASIDAARAAGRLLADDEEGALCAAPRVAIYGGSQGGHAALWVDRLWPYYTTELSLEGTIAAIPPSDLLAQVSRAIPAIVDATANTLWFFGTVAGWYGYDDALSEFFVEEALTALRAMLSAPCDDQPDINPEDFMSPELLFTSEVVEAAEAGEFDSLDPWGCIARENGLTTTSVQRRSTDPEHYGILFTVSEEDTLVHPPVERAAYTQLCEAGLPLQYIECAGADHEDGAIWSLPEVGRFLDARFAREPFEADASCEVGEAVVCEGTPQE